MLFALVLSVAMASTAEFRPMDIRQCRAGARSRMCLDPGTGGGGTPPPLLRILPATGAGAPLVDTTSFCTNFASELVGSYICLRGDGTSALGAGVTLTPAGGITTVAPRICPNGPDCAPITAQAFDGVGAYTSNHAAPPAGNFSACTLARVRSAATFPAEVFLRTASTYLQIDAALVRLRVNGTFASVAIGAPQGRWVFACGTYRRVTNGTSVGIAYADGVAGTTVSTMPLPNVADFPVAIGTQLSTENVDIALALYTEKELTPATITAMTTQVFGGSLLTADGVGAVAHSRNSTVHCVAGDGSLAQVRLDAPCITKPPGFVGPAMLVEGARTNSLTRSEELNSWTPNSSTVTANAIAAPTRAIAAEQITDNTAGGVEHGVTRAVSGLAAGGDQSFSAFVKAGTLHRFCLKVNYGYAFANLNLGTAFCSGGGNIGCRLEQYADGWWRIISTWSGATPTIASVGLSVHLNNQDIANCIYTGDGTGTGFAWGVQAESASWASSYIKTEATATTRAATLATMTLPAGITNTQGCGGATVASQANQSAGTSGAILGFGSGAERALGVGATNSIFNMSDGTLTPVLSVSDSTLGPVDGRGIWSTALGQQWVASGMSEGTRLAYDGAIIASPLAIGSTSTGTAQHWGYIGNIRMGDQPNACP